MTNSDRSLIMERLISKDDKDNNVRIYNTFSVCISFTFHLYDQIFAMSIIDCAVLSFVVMPELVDDYSGGISEGTSASFHSARVDYSR